jgi:hypothetical protein
MTALGIGGGVMEGDLVAVVLPHFLLELPSVGAVDFEAGGKLLHALQATHASDPACAAGYTCVGSCMRCRLHMRQNEFRCCFQHNSCSAGRYFLMPDCPLLMLLLSRLRPLVC